MSNKSTLSNSAKAAAVFMFFGGVKSMEEAVLLYDQMESGDEPLDLILESYPEIYKWDQLDHMNEEDWWEALEALALTIDAARQHFKE